MTLEQPRNWLVFENLQPLFTFSNGLTLCFFVLSFIGILHHEMWNDELQAWLLARDSDSIFDLFANMKDEGHPALWHLGLFGLTRLTQNPIAMQFFHLLIATGVVYVFARFSPFNQPIKCLFTFSYFPFFEYGLISRSYSLGVLLIFIFCTLFPSRKRSYIPLSIILFLLANTHLYGLLIALSLAGTLAVELIIDREQNRIFDPDTLISVLIVSLGVGISILQITRILETSSSYLGGGGGARESGLVDRRFAGIYTYRLKLAIASIVQSYVPLPNLSTYYFWGSNFLSTQFISANLPGFLNPSKLSVLLSAVLMVISGGLLLSKPASLFLYSSGTFSILLFGYLKFPGALRHKGHLFIVLIASLWLFHHAAPMKWFKLGLLERKRRKYQNLFLTLILSIQVFAGIYAYRMDLQYPFSNSKAAAQFIQDQGLESMVLLGQRDNAVHTIVGFLGTQAYYPGLNRFGSFLVKTNRRQDLEPAEIPAVLTETLEKESEILFIATEPLSIELSTFSLQQLAYFASGFGRQEDYYLYLVKAQKS